MDDLKDIATRELVAELMEREGVEATTLAPNSKATVEAEGPAIILNIID